MTHGAAWLGHYRTPLPIRCRGAFHLYATQRLDSAAPRVVVIGSRRTDAARVGACFDEIERAHRLIAESLVPWVAERGVVDEVPYLAFECDACCDFEDILVEALDSKRKASYSAATTLFNLLCTTLHRVHQIDDPKTDQPLVLGALSLSNLLVSPSGRLWLIGFGHNLALENELGEFSLGSGSVYQAPEISMGGPATPQGDAYALLDWARGMFRYTQVFPHFLRVLRGEALPGDEIALEHHIWHLQNVYGRLPHERATLDQIDARHQETNSRLGIQLDPAAIEAFLAQLVTERAGQRDALRDDAAAIEGSPSSKELIVGQLATFIQAGGGEIVSLESRRNLRFLVWGFVENWLETRQQSLTIDQLVQIGWPGERPIREAAINRIHVALSTIRKMGLKDFVERHCAGYRLRPDTVVRIVTE